MIVPGMFQTLRVKLARKHAKKKCFLFFLLWVLLVLLPLGSSKESSMPLVAGCPEGRRLSDLNIETMCFGLSPGQKKILWLLKEAGFGSLVPSRPTYSNTGTNSYLNDGFHNAGATDMDFYVPGADGEPIASPEILRAFLALDSIWPGGLGIGILAADRHLHVDVRHTKDVCPRWIEISKVLGTEYCKGVGKKYEEFFPLLRQTYQYFGDGGVDWSKVAEQNDLSLAELLKNIQKSAEWFESVLKWSVIGLGLYFGLKVLKYVK